MFLTLLFLLTALANTKLQQFYCHDSWLWDFGRKHALPALNYCAEHKMTTCFV